MTEVEKLRALLAEARIRIAPCVQAPCTNDGCCLRSRIDATLAEPMIAPTPPSLLVFSEIADGLKRERDEARAEVEQLNLALQGAENSISAHNEHEARLRLECSMLAQEAYQRGAEAMREAAASAVFDRHTTGLLSPAAVTAAVRVIRALPIPEDGR